MGAARADGGIFTVDTLAFLTPLGHPVNVLVMGTGGYKFRDYYKSARR